MLFSALITELVQKMGEQSMTMQNTPLLMSRILGRGALLDPEVEVVTQQINGTHRQTLGKTWARANQVANALRAHGIKVGDRVGCLLDMEQGSVYFFLNGKNQGLAAEDPCFTKGEFFVTVGLGRKDEEITLLNPPFEFKTDSYE